MRVHSSIFCFRFCAADSRFFSFNPSSFCGVDFFRAVFKLSNFHFTIIDSARANLVVFVFQSERNDAAGVRQSENHDRFSDEFSLNDIVVISNRRDEDFIFFSDVFGNNRRENIVPRISVVNAFFINKFNSFQIKSFFVKPALV